jgi:hypothetical protein
MRARLGRILGLLVVLTGSGAHAAEQAALKKNPIV